MHQQRRQRVPAVRLRRVGQQSRQGAILLRRRAVRCGRRRGPVPWCDVAVLRLGPASALSPTASASALTAVSALATTATQTTAATALTTQAAQASSSAAATVAASAALSAAVTAVTATAAIAAVPSARPLRVHERGGLCEPRRERRASVRLRQVGP